MTSSNDASNLDNLGKGDGVGHGRRAKDRREHDVPVNHKDRRKADRRSGNDRRENPRHSS